MAGIEKVSQLLLLPLLIATVGAWACVGLPASSAQEDTGSDTGMFLILAEAGSKEDLRPLRLGEQAARYDYKFLRESEARPARYFILHEYADVPLDLAEPVQSRQGQLGTTELSFTLTPEAAAAAERMSRENLGKNVALLIDGEVITAHKVRSVITDGRFVLSRCTDNACEYIRARLAAR